MRDEKGFDVVKLFGGGWRGTVLAIVVLVSLGFAWVYAGYLSQQPCMELIERRSLAEAQEDPEFERVCGNLRYRTFHVGNSPTPLKAPVAPSRESGDTAR
jgi:hypothetical protein